MTHTKEEFNVAAEDIVQKLINAGFVLRKVHRPSFGKLKPLPAGEYVAIGEQDKMSAVLNGLFCGVAVAVSNGKEVRYYQNNSRVFQCNSYYAASHFDHYAIIEKPAMKRKRGDKKYWRKNKRRD